MSSVSYEDALKDVKCYYSDEGAKMKNIGLLIGMILFAIIGIALGWRTGKGLVTVFFLVLAGLGWYFGSAAIYKKYASSPCPSS